MGTDADGARPRKLTPPRNPHQVRESVKQKRAAEKKKPSRRKRLSARNRRDLDVSVKVQGAYQFGYKTGVTKGLTSNTTARTARERVTLPRVETNALRSRLESARKSVSTQVILMSSIANERGELVREPMCLACMDQQWSIAVMPCNHIPLCYECLLNMRNTAKAKGIECPMCQTAISGHIELSPGALPRAATV